MIEAGFCQVFLISEVTINGALGQARGAGDVRQSRALVTLFVENWGYRFNDSFLRSF